MYVFIGNGRENSEESALKHFALVAKAWEDEKLITELSEAMTNEEFRRIKHLLQGNDNIYIRSTEIFLSNF